MACDTSQLSQTCPKTHQLSAPCPCCGKPITVRQDGCIRTHGPAGAHCPGSGQVPQAASSSADINVHADPISGPLSFPVSSSPSVDTLSRPVCGETLKHIPRGARLRASQLLEKRLRAVVSAPGDKEAWRDLLQFGSCLQRPGRGGKRRNLTTQVLHQIDQTERDHFFSLVSDSSSQSIHRKRAKQRLKYHSRMQKTLRPLSVLQSNSRLAISEVPCDYYAQTIHSRLQAQTSDAFFSQSIQSNLLIDAPILSSHLTP